MGKAYRQITSDKFLGHAALYRLDPPVSQSRWDYDTDEDVETLHEHVIVSGVNTSYDHEVLIFPGTEDGEIASWAEIAGIRGATDHQAALNLIDYVIAEDPMVIVQPGTAPA